LGKVAVAMRASLAPATAGDSWLLPSMSTCKRLNAVFLSPASCTACTSPPACRVGSVPVMRRVESMDDVGGGAVDEPVPGVTEAWVEILTSPRLSSDALAVMAALALNCVPSGVCQIERKSMPMATTPVGPL
jgi:hypothetical protein